METGLHAVEHRIPSAPLDQFIVGAIRNEAPIIDGYNSVGASNRRQPVRYDENRAVLGDFFKIFWITRSLS